MFCILLISIQNHAFSQNAATSDNIAKVIAMFEKADDVKKTDIIRRLYGQVQLLIKDNRQKEAQDITIFIAENSSYLKIKNPEFHELINKSACKILLSRGEFKNAIPYLQTLNRDPESDFILGQLHLNNLHPESNPRKGYNLIKKAEFAGNKDAQDYLIKEYPNGYFNESKLIQTKDFKKEITKAKKSNNIREIIQTLEKMGPLTGTKNGPMFYKEVSLQRIKRDSALLIKTNQNLPLKNENLEDLKKIVFQLAQNDKEFQNYLSKYKIKSRIYLTQEIQKTKNTFNIGQFD